MTVLDVVKVVVLSINVIVNVAIVVCLVKMRNKK